MRLLNQNIVYLSRERTITIYNIVQNNRTIIKVGNNVSLSDFVILDGRNKTLLMSGFDKNLYLYKNSKISKIDYDCKEFVDIMEIMKVQGKLYIIIAYENGTLELVNFDPSDNTMKLVNKFLTGNLHSISKVIFNFKE